MAVRYRVPSPEIKTPRRSDVNAYVVHVQEINRILQPCFFFCLGLLSNGDHVRDAVLTLDSYIYIN